MMPSEGSSSMISAGLETMARVPVLVDEMFELFAGLRTQGITILLVEQNVERALKISDRAYIMDQGVIVHSADARSLLADKDIQDRYCSV
jgi:branched-chain amino acid transport system ATP-binding protein